MGAFNSYSFGFDAFSEDAFYLEPPSMILVKSVVCFSGVIDEIVFNGDLVDIQFNGNIQTNC